MYDDRVVGEEVPFLAVLVVDWMGGYHQSMKTLLMEGWDVDPIHESTSCRRVHEKGPQFIQPCYNLK